MKAHRTWQTVLIAGAVALIFPLLASATGELDSTFGVGGKVLTDFGGADYVHALALQDDGKIIAAGETLDVTTFESEFVVARYAADGSLDAGFGVGGEVTTNFGGPTDTADAVAIQTDGKIVAAGTTADGAGSDIALARYKADGSPDETFDLDGKVLTDFDSTIDVATALTIQPDGKLLVAGRTRPFGPIATNPYNFALARYNADGSLDPSFDGDGKVATDFAGSEDWAWGLDVAPDGKIVVAGYQLNRAASSAAIEVARYNVDGSLDSTFGGGDGKVLDESAVTSGAYDVVVDPDGGVVVAGGVNGESSHAGGDLALVRYSSSGSLDSDFGVGGVARADFGMEASAAVGLVRQPDGRFLAAGYASPDAEPTLQTDTAFAIARFDDSGQLDESFYGGEVLTHFGSATSEVAEAIALQPDGKVLLGGTSAPFSQSGETQEGDLALARYLPPPGYTPGGSNIEVSPIDRASGRAPVKLTFTQVHVPGQTSLTTKATGPSPPAQWFHGQPIVYYDLTTTAAYSGPIEVCVEYQGISFAGDPRIYHYVNGSWNELATSVDSVSETACAETESLSHFALLAQDTTPPTNPSLSSASHAVGAWLNDDTVEVLWTAASDNWSGLDGYSYDFSANPLGVPDTVKDAEETASAVTSQPFADGESYFHLRSVDNSGNWSAAVHLGPLRIDRSPPLNPVLRGVSHVVGSASTKAVVEVAWSGASDSLSGVDGFSLEWSKGAGKAPDTLKDAEESATGTRSAPLPVGSWFLNLQTRDHAGNWSAPTSIGPFVIVGPGTRLRCVVPNVKGKTLVQARRLLASKRCTLGKVTKAYSRKVRKGRVISQRPSAGRRLARGAKVHLKVSRGRQPSSRNQ
jgi:uncharacterized delta-60 repeat protein